MASTGGARAHDPQYGCESRSGPLTLGAGKGLAPAKLVAGCAQTDRGRSTHPATVSEHLVAREVGPSNGGNQ